MIVSKQLHKFASIPVFIGAILIFLFGILDDILDLPAIVKLIVQMTASAVVTIFGLRFTQIFAWELPTVLSYIITFGWIIGVVNAYNLIDGLDGLCGSLSCTGVMALGIIYLVSNNMEAGLCFILAGAILGFLMFNWPPAKIFMGDDGSQFLGYMIAVLPLYSSNSEAFEFNKFLIMLIITAFPVFDTIAAIWRRIRDKKPVMSPDKAHLHHKMLNLGYSKTVTLYIIFGIQVLLCIAVITSTFLGKYKAITVLTETFCFMVIFFAIIHYTNRAVNRKHNLEAEQKKAEENKEAASGENTETQE